MKTRLVFRGRLVNRLIDWILGPIPNPFSAGAGSTASPLGSSPGKESRLGSLARNAGSALLITLVTMGVIGLYMAAYLNLVSHQNISTSRSSQWNTAIPVAEAGVEEALTHLYHDPIIRTGNGWNFVNGAYIKERIVADTKYVTTISTNFSPDIVSKAYVRKPQSNEYLDPPRTVRITVTNRSFFSKGMIARGVIQLNGYGIRIDSFDSKDPLYSTNGNYDPAKFKDNGDVGTNSTMADSFNSWNAQIYGKAHTGPGGTVLVGNNGSIGSLAWHQGGNTGVQPGWSSDDMNISFPDVEPPFQGGAITPSSGAYGGTNYAYVLTSGNWELASLSMSGNDAMLVLGDAVLYVKGNVSVSSSAQINVASNAVLRMFVAGPDASIGGKGVVNSPGNATNFFYFGLPTNKTLSMSGNAAFTGAIYAPNASLTLGGGGNNNYDFAGACVTDSVYMNGHYKFHYDENLRRVLPSRFTIVAWNEM